MLIGLSLGNSIKLGVFLCLILGGCGWIRFFQKKEIHNSYIVFLSIMLGSFCGISFTNYATANVILYAITPFFILWVLRISDLSVQASPNLKLYSTIAVLLFSLGFFSWIKLSGIIVAGTIGAYLFFFMAFGKDKQNKIKLIFIFIFLGVGFWMPFFLLELVNHHLSGITADHFYSGNDSDLQAPLFGKFWGNSTTGVLLIWSLISSPGYSLPLKEVAHGLRDLTMQFPEIIELLHSVSINEHVMVAGFIGFFLTIILIKETIRFSNNVNRKSVILLCCFLIIHFTGLEILSYKYRWNYLLYHAHTYEFWLLFLLPVFANLTSSNKATSSTLFLFIASTLFPITNNIERLALNFSQENQFNPSKTEKRRDFASNRFSKSIEFIEKNSKSVLDVIYFLPYGDMGDLTLRTRMRSMATHFSGDNFPSKGNYHSSKALNIYCAYDKILSENQNFINALASKFPQQVKREIIFSGNIVVEKIHLEPRKKLRG